MQSLSLNMQHLFAVFGQYLIAILSGEFLQYDTRLALQNTSGASNSMLCSLLT